MKSLSFRASSKIFLKASNSSIEGFPPTLTKVSVSSSSKKHFSTVTLLLSATTQASSNELSLKIFDKRSKS
jgi:hypothetical protein